MANVVIKTRYQAYNIDALNRTAKCASDIDNGCVFALNSKSEDENEKDVWVATAPTSNTDTGLWMAASPEIPIVKDTMGNEYKGITSDPRAFVNYAGKMIDAFKLVVDDEIEITGDGITDISTTANKYLVPDTGSFVLKASSSAGTGFYLEKVGTNRLHIGTGAIAGKVIPTYVYVCKKN